MSTDHIRAVDLIKVGNLYQGSNETKFTTFGTIEDADNVFFSNFRFLGPAGYGRSFNFDYRASSNIERVRNWDQAFIVDPTNIESIVDAMDYQLRYNGCELKLFEFSIKTEIKEVNTMVDEFELRRKWKALSKLTTDEVKLLGLEKEMIHLKLKYENVPNDDDLDVPF
jgi:hypothetical protein